MTADRDPRLTTLERRLERGVVPRVSPRLRHRVLAGVDDVLAERLPAIAPGGGGRALFPCHPVLVAGTLFPLWAGAAAMVAGVALATSCLATIGPLRQLPPVALAERLRSAGVADEGLPGGLVQGADAAFAGSFAAAPAAGARSIAPLPFARPDTSTQAARAAFRAIDARRLLEENP